VGGGGTSLASGDGCGRAWVSDVLGLPDDIAACLFDLDGVLTRTGQAEALRAHGTDVVVGDLTELLDVP